MKMRSMLVAVTALFVFSAMIVISSGQTQDVLKPGEYTAKVKAITCGGCGPLIVKTMKAMKEIESVSVDSAKKTVQFAIKKDMSLKMADLEKALKAAATDMGMGADYSLLDLKATK